MKYVPWAGWPIALIFIILFYHSCQTPKIIVTTAKGDSIVAIATGIHIQDSIKIDSFSTVSSYWKNKYDSLFGSFAKKEQQVVTSANAVQKLSDSIKYYRAVNDTLKELTTIGDLLDEDSVLLETLSQAKIEIDSLHTAHKQEEDACDSMNSVYRDEIGHLLSGITQLHLQYTDAVAEENKLIKKNKVNSIWAKVATLTTAILGAILILQK